LAFEVLRRRNVCRYSRNSAKAERSFERKTKRHVTTTGNAGRKHATSIDTDFGNELVDHRRQESHVVNVELVRAVIPDNVARVPIAFVPIGIDDGKAMFVGKALEPIPRCYSHSPTVSARTVHHHHKWCSLLSLALQPTSKLMPYCAKNIDSNCGRIGTVGELPATL